LRRQTEEIKRRKRKIYKAKETTERNEIQGKVSSESVDERISEESPNSTVKA
jgi:hypothetical protein